LPLPRPNTLTRCGEHAATTTTSAFAHTLVAHVSSPTPKKPWKSSVAAHSDAAADRLHLWYRDDVASDALTAAAEES
jgi:hypothetical protein